jgi:hypothetical protein
MVVENLPSEISCFEVLVPANSYKMRSHINGALSGALGRMKELGLIHPVRVGRNKNFKATDFGGEILDDHQPQ